MYSPWRTDKSEKKSEKGLLNMKRYFKYTEDIMSYELDAKNYDTEFPLWEIIFKCFTNKLSGMVTLTINERNSRKMINKTKYFLKVGEENTL